MTSLRIRLAAFALAALVACPVFGQARGPRPVEHWVTTWATAVVARPQGSGRAGAPASPRGQGTVAPAIVLPGNGTAPAGGSPAARAGARAPQAARRGGPPPVTISNQTLRQIVHTSAGGSRVRVVFSNAFGTAPIEIGAARVALRRAGAELVPGSSRPLTFSGRAAYTVVPGAIAVSDAVDLTVPATSDLAIDLFLPGDLGVPATTHGGASQTSYVSQEGNHAGEDGLPASVTTTSWFLLARVEVVAPPAAATIVAFGDSITEGFRSTVDANSRWPDYLARRLAARRGGAPVSVANAGISGNRLLGDGAGVSALARFDRDALMVTGATHVVIMEGINDIGLARTNPSPAADDLIAAQRQLLARARARGLRVYGATLTPFEGASYWTAEGEAKRTALNQWIRTGGEYDAVIDFDAVVRDPVQPTKLLPAYDSGDHLHPNDAGYRAMGESVDLSLFTPAGDRGTGRQPAAR